MFVFFQNIVSPHQLPLAREVAKRVGVDNFAYIYSEPFHEERAAMGWSDKVEGLRVERLSDLNRQLLEDADVVYTGLRCLDLMERRLSRGKLTYYTSERWFKPLRFSLPGWLRLLSPSYFRMARRFVRLATTSQYLHVLPIGVHAYRDMQLLFRIFAGKEGKGKLTLWGYFVAPPSSAPTPSICTCSSILWVGRMLALKNVDVLIRAVALANEKLAPTAPRLTLTLVGDGPEKPHLQSLASTLYPLSSTLYPLSSTLSFLPSVPIDEVRSLMRKHDVYVFPSNGFDGWGAVVSEALEEGMLVLGSDEAGASATMLPPSHRFHCRDHRRLAELLIAAANGKLPRVPIGNWTAANAADML